MKTLASDISSSLAVFAGAKPRILIEIAATGGTLYYSDQYLYTGTQSYDGRLKNIGSIRMESSTGEDHYREGKVSITLSNHSPVIDSSISPGDAVDIYIWDLNAAAASKFKIFSGTVNDDINIDYYDYSFTCTDVSAKYNKLIGDKLTSDIWSGANPDPSDIGKVMPIVYGSVKDVRCLAVEAGAATTLSADITAGATTINVTSTSIPIAFPSSGSLIIGTETVNYTGKTETSFTGCTRGASGSTATTHSHGDSVFENVATLKYIASGRAVKDLTNARIVPWGSPIQEAISINSFVPGGGYNVNDGGYATITLNNIPNLKKNIALAITPASHAHTIDTEHTHTTSDPQHNHSSGSVSTDVFLDSFVEVSASGSYSWSNKPYIYDQSLDSYAEYTNGAAFPSHGLYDFKVLRSFTYSASGSSVQIKARLNWEADSSLGSNYASMQLWVNGSLKQTINLTGTSGQEATSFYSTTFAQISQSNTYILVDINDIGYPNKIRFLEAWYTIQYTPSTNNSSTGVTASYTGSTALDVTALGTVGDTVADSLGGYLVCDIDGEPDVAGHYTGSGTTLLEKPVDIIHHILEVHTNGPVAHANIDLAGSFADAETNHPSLDKFAFVINQQIWVNELLHLLAQQFFCRFIWEAGTAKLNRIKTSASSINNKSIDTDYDSVMDRGKLAVTKSKWGKPQVWNDVTVNYELDLINSGGNWFNSDAYKQFIQDEDSTSITANGRKTRTFNAFAIGDNTTMATDLRDKLLAFYKDNRELINFLSWSTSADLERGDEIDITCSQLSLTNFDAQIINIVYDFPNRRGKPFLITINALEI